MLSEAEQKSDIAVFWSFIKQHFKILLIYFVAGGVIAFGLTFLMPKEYKSYGMIFPPSSTSIDNSIDFPNFGYDVEADRLIQILGSTEIRDAVMRKFDLTAHFQVDTTKVVWRDNFMKKYYKNIKFERTPAMSVLISARTKDAELSSEIVNYIILLGDAFREKIYKQNIITAFENARQDYESQKHLVDSIELTLGEKLKQNNLSSLLFLMSDAQISFDMDKLNSINTTSDATIGGNIIEFKGMYELLKEYRNRYIKVKKTYTNPIPKLYVINYGEPNYRKISPSFSINAIVGALFAMCMAAAVMFIRKNMSRD